MNTKQIRIKKYVKSQQEVINNLLKLKSKYENCELYTYHQNSLERALGVKPT